MTKAWHLRQDGEAFPVSVHLYPMQDDDLSSEAEVSAFMLSTKSKDTDLSEHIIDAWLAIGIEDLVSYDADSDAIDNCILEFLGSLPYSFAYPLNENTILDIHHRQNNYYDVDSLYQFVDSVRADIRNLQERISYSFNQQFCRVRFGGKYNSEVGNNEIWFRIASVNYNWANTIYVFTSSVRRRLDITNITICRDPESDNGYGYTDDDYFYQAKDGTAYYHMPIEEYLVEEHEHSPVFNSSKSELNRGIFATVRQLLSVEGNTFEGVTNSLVRSNIRLPRPSNMWSYLVRREQKMCISGSEWTDSLPNRTMSKVAKIESMILSEFPEISDIDVDCKPRANTKGKMVGFEMIFTLKSDIGELDNLDISIVSTKSFSDTLAESVVRLFRIEYTDYIEYKNISID